MQKSPLKFIWSYLKNFKFFLFLIVSLAIFSRLFNQGTAWFLAKMFDYASSNQPSQAYWSSLFVFILCCAGLNFAGAACQMLSMWFGNRLVPHIRSLVIKDVFAYVNKHSIAYFTNEMTGNISNKFNQLQGGVVEFFMQSGNIMFDCCFLITNLAILSFIDWRLGVAIAVWSVAMFFVGRFFGRRRAELSRKTSTQQSLSNAMIVDSIANYSEIKSFANYKYERMYLLQNLRQWRHTETTEQKQKTLIGFYLHVVAVLSGLFFMLLSALLMYGNFLNVTEFIFVLTIFGQLIWMVFGVNWAFNNMSRILGQLTSALETLAVEPDIVDAANAVELKASKAAIRFDDVCFRYKSGRPIFENFNLDIKVGEKVGIVGSSGAGKSTLIKLLARYFDVCSGSVKINGTDIKTVSQDSLHKHIAIIPQDVCLFNRSLKDNIRYGKTDASENEIIKASKAASADKFIEKLSEKYDTKVGDRGVVLSGGERQRIAIARAILKDAPVLIFDEATSSLDSESEKYIQSSLKKLMKNKTVVAIAHRLSTLREMDRIIVLEDGKIVEQGTHLGLLRKKGRYAKLFKMQSDGYLQST